MLNKLSYQFAALLVDLFLLSLSYILLTIALTQMAVYISGNDVIFYSAPLLLTILGESYWGSTPGQKVYDISYEMSGRFRFARRFGHAFMKWLSVLIIGGVGLVESFSLTEGMYGVTLFPAFVLDHLSPLQRLIPLGLCMFAALILVLWLLGFYENLVGMRYQRKTTSNIK